MSETSVAKQRELVVGSITIKEVYSRWLSPIDVSKAVKRLIQGLPSRYLVGLKTIVVTDAAGLNHEGRRAKTWTRGKKIAIHECQGLYHQAFGGEPAWIEMFADNIVKSWPLWLLKVPFIADLALSEALFHEIGHHLHRTQAPEFREREDVADHWQKRLSRIFFRKRYWYLMPVAYLLWPLYWLKKKLTRSKEHR